MGKFALEDIEAGLTHRNWCRRLKWAERTDWGPPTPEQVERGLTDGHWWVRAVWARRADYTPTPEQVERGLADRDEEVRKAWRERLKKKETIFDILPSFDIDLRPVFREAREAF